MLGVQNKNRKHVERALDVIRAPAFANWILFKAGLSLLQGPGGHQP